MRLWIRNAEGLGPKNQKGLEKVLIPWEPLCAAIGALNKAVQTCLQQLKYMSTSYSISTSTAMDIVIRQCEELFEFNRDVSASGVRRLCVEDIPASTLLWPRSKPLPQSKATSTATGLLSDYNKMSAPRHTVVQNKSRYEIDIKSFANQAIIFLESRVLLGASRLLYRELTEHLVLSLLPPQTRFISFKATFVSLVKIAQEDAKTALNQLQLLEHAYKYGTEISNKELIDLSQSYYLSLALPMLPSLENMEIILELRQSISFQDSLKNRFVTMESDRFGFEYVVHELLIAELQHNVDIHLFSDSLKDKMRYIRNWKGVYNAIELCGGFAWEASAATIANIITSLTSEEIGEKKRLFYRSLTLKAENGEKLTAEEVEKDKKYLSSIDKNEDYFLKSLKIGAGFLTQNWNYEGGPLYSNKKCLSPTTFMALAEKYVVLALVYSKKCENILLPKSLTFDVLCRQNDAYGNLVTSCTTSSQLSQSKNEALSSVVYSIVRCLIGM